MATPLSRQNLEDREFDKFGKKSTDQTAVHTISEIAGGELSVIPPKSSRVTTMLVGDTPTLLPAVALPGRTAIAWFNKSTTETLYVNGVATVTADDTLGTDAGWETGPQESSNESVDPTATIYAIAPAGKTILIKVREWSKLP